MDDGVDQGAGTATGPPSDADLLALLRTDPPRGWELFLGRYADLIWSDLARMGFDHDEAGDRFVFVCEKLAEDGFRRLRGVRHLGRRGELKPWLRRVVQNLVVSWAWSREGRRRLLRPIERLPRLEQRVFQLYFWAGLRPHEVFAVLRGGEFPQLVLPAVHDALERVLETLSPVKLWRLRSQFERRRGPLRWEDLGGEGSSAVEPADSAPDPEARLLASEAEARIAEALAGLAPRDRWIAALRFEEGLAPVEIADLVRRPLAEVRDSLRRSREALARRLR